jgi:signal peptidase II
MHSPKYNPKPAFLLMALVIILDQLTKIWARISLQLGDSVPILDSIFGETFRLTLVQNTGAAFSLSPGTPLFNRIFFIATALLATAFIIWLLYQNSSKLQVTAFGLVMGGALGNAIDRAVIGSVTDFFDVNFPDFIMHRFPIFNIADSAIFIAMVLLIFEMIFLTDKSKGKIEPQPVLPEIDSTNKEI